MQMKVNAQRPLVACKVATRAPRRVVAARAAAVEAPAVSAEVVDKCINSIRFLAIDGVNKANSGHPGCPMGAAPMSYVVWNECMKFNPKNPQWINRDRFVLSAGHASMLQYSLLHLCGYDSVKMDDLKQFRQWGSMTPGHPENFVTPGVEVTTGPLGQGIANAVGIAAAEAHLAARFNKPDAPKIIDNYTYCILGDGCMMEGISQEAASLAGHWGLGKLIALYDDNQISIDGHTDISFTEDVAKRFEANGWQVLHVKDGNTDVEAIRNAIAEAKACTDKPTLIKVSTLIGYGSPNKADSHDAHGAPLGKDETALTRQNLKWEYGEFEVPDEVYQAMRDAKIEAGAKLNAEWDKAFAEYKEKYPEEAADFECIVSGKLPGNWADCLPTFTSEDKGLATRAYSQTMLNAVAPAVPGFLGGSADLAPSNLTLMKMFGDFQKNQYAERNLRFGVREHGMGAICNGISSYAKGLIPYCATFFIFTDYMRAAMRVAALSEMHHVFVMTHDSIGLGEDGPTHQPIEHLASFRAMPNLLTIRPAGGNETAGAYKVAVENQNGPTLLVLSRQGMPNYDACTVDNVAKGAYIVKDCEGEPTHILIGTGSELCLCMDAAEKLESEGVKVRVVSMPCTELFDAQSAEYHESVLPAAVTKRVSVEAASTYGWERYVGAQGKALGVDRFGASAPAPVIYEKFGLTVDGVVAAAKAL